MMRRKPKAAYSVRRRLTIAVVSASVLLWLISLVLIVQIAWRETSDVFDDALKEGARLALVLGANLQAQGALAGDDTPTQPEPAKLKLHYQIVDNRGHVLRRAQNAPAQAFSTEVQELRGYRNTWVDGQAWRVYLLRSEGLEFQVQIGQPWAERTELLEEMAEDLVWPALVLLALLGLFCWFMIRHLLQPIERTAQHIAAKSPDDLRPMPMEHEPREMQSIVQAFNGVLQRLDQALQAERRFTADAAHELRTPLAALRMRIQLLQRQQVAHGTSAEDHALQALRDDIDRCTSLVEGLLTLARLEPQSANGLQTERIDLHSLFQRLDNGQAALRGMQLSFTGATPLPTLIAHPALLESALRNLLDNAFRYGAPGTQVQLEATIPAHGGVAISVKDDGPGVAPEDQARLTERFFRVLGSDAAGSGLGLSIVARIAALHGATLRFSPGLGGRGLGATLLFPPA